MRRKDWRVHLWKLCSHFLWLFSCASMPGKTWEEAAVYVFFCMYVNIHDYFEVTIYFFMFMKMILGKSKTVQKIEKCILKRKVTIFGNFIIKSELLSTFYGLLQIYFSSSIHIQTYVWVHRNPYSLVPHSVAIYIFNSAAFYVTLCVFHDCLMLLSMEFHKYLVY